ncbi:MAG: hypothetical protein IJ811_05310 [Clostridia bacterium]|nr:hypothetical protein [Clostridia bacterium]
MKIINKLFVGVIVAVLICFSAFALVGCDNEDCSDRSQSGETSVQSADSASFEGWASRSGEGNGFDGEYDFFE